MGAALPPGPFDLPETDGWVLRTVDAGVMRRRGV